MAKLTWDNVGERYYETGVKKGVLYPYVGITDTNTEHEYPKGVAWNGLSSVSESPSGAEASAIYADDIKYLNLYSKEEFGATVEAYTYPDEFAACDGSAELAAGIMLGQQSRQSFGLSYVTTVGNDTQGEDYGYKIHIIYGAKATPSEKQYSTINDSPEAITLSWTLETIAVEVDGHKPTACITIDSTKVDSDALAKIEAALYGTADEEAYLPTPAELLDLVSTT